MSNKDTNKARKPQPNRPPTVQCPNCHEWYSITGPKASYHQSAACVQS